MQTPPNILASTRAQLPQHFSLLLFAFVFCAKPLATALLDVRPQSSLVEEVKASRTYLRDGKGNPHLFFARLFPVPSPSPRAPSSVHNMGASQRRVDMDSRRKVGRQTQFDVRAVRRYMQLGDLSRVGSNVVVGVLFLFPDYVPRAP